MLKQMIHITHGYMIWMKYRRRFHIDCNTVTLVLAGENERVDYYALQCLEHYVKRKIAKKAVILTASKKGLEQSEKRNFLFPTETHIVDEKELLSLYRYYCFEEYFDNIAFTYTRKPKDNLLWRLLKEQDVDEKEAVCLGCYCLRRVP